MRGELGRRWWRRRRWRGGVYLDVVVLEVLEQLRAVRREQREGQPVAREAVGLRRQAVGRALRRVEKG